MGATGSTWSQLLRQLRWPCCVPVLVRPPIAGLYSDECNHLSPPMWCANLDNAHPRWRLDLSWQAMGRFMTMPLLSCCFVVQESTKASSWVLCDSVVELLGSPVFGGKSRVSSSLWYLWCSKISLCMWFFFFFSYINSLGHYFERCVHVVLLPQHSRPIQFVFIRPLFKFRIRHYLHGCPEWLLHGMYLKTPWVQ